MIGRLFRRDREAGPARELYGRIVAAARQPAFYRALGVPDSVDGRFELIALHLFLVLHRLKRASMEPGIEPTATLAQSLFDTAFADMDTSLREMGAGDLGVGRRVKQMATGFYGRAAAYEEGLAGSAGLEQALRRNLYGTVEPTPAALAAMARYLRTAAETLARQPTASLGAGRVEFPAIVLPASSPAS
jgi:cytochrome b pre-mRNA-processing protein 3